ncbi:hypothetical protein, partial [Streptomyces sp. SID161]|uniref:hypothetical protein n=1 Tax=Streptomyces sp. SID161 TaxID=2690251 RepID=UPI001F24978F
MPRRLLPLLVAALVCLAGCTTVSSRPTPGSAPPRDVAVRPSVLTASPIEASARTALVRTGHGHRPRPDSAAGPTPDPRSGG